MADPTNKTASDSHQAATRDNTGQRTGPRHTQQGAPTDAAHQDAGDGALTGSVPAGLTREEFAERARNAGRDDSAVD